MCGIIGRYRRCGGSTPLQKIDIARIRHRGPDSQGHFLDDFIALGHTRLSILDLTSQGQQPMASRDSRYILIFNGEIYNFLELRRELENLGHNFRSRTDTEVVLAAYQQWGVECLARFRGMFAFALWDCVKHSLFLARDRFGEKPLVYRRDRETFCFSSEMKALVPLLPQVPPLSPTAVDMYLHYQYVPEPLTPLEGVFKLPPAHYLVITPDDWDAAPKPYWRIEDAPVVTGDPIPLIQAELKKAIALTLRSDVPVGVALSGGIDSGGIAAIAAPGYHETMKCFSVGYPGRPPYDERDQAESLARHLGLEYHDVELRTDELVAFFPQLVAHMNDPIADIAAYGHYAVARAAADEGIKVLLTGIGGDEVFWGYAWTRDLIRTNRKKLGLASSPSRRLAGRVGKYCNSSLMFRLTNSRKVPGIIRKLAGQLTEAAAMGSIPDDEAVFMSIVPDFNQAIALAPELYAKSFAVQIPPRNAFSPLKLPLDGTEDAILIVRKLLFDTWLVSNCLDLGDGVSMGSSVETRIPFLDYRLIELIVGLEKGNPCYQPGYKTWLKKALQGILPDDVMARPKQGFQPPVFEWLQNLVGTYGDLLYGGYLMRCGMFDDQSVSKMIEGELGSIFFVYKVVLLELWYRNVVVGECK